MNPIYSQIIVVVVGNVVFLFLNMYYVHWRKRAEKPEELQKQINTLRGQVKYIEGRLNGKHWLKEN